MPGRLKRQEAFSMLVNHFSTSARAYEQLQDWNLLHWGKATSRGAISIKNVDYSFKLILELLFHACGAAF